LIATTAISLSHYNNEVLDTIKFTYSLSANQRKHLREIQYICKSCRKNSSWWIYQIHYNFVVIMLYFYC